MCNWCNVCLKGRLLCHQTWVLKTFHSQGRYVFVRARKEGVGVGGCWFQIIWGAADHPIRFLSTSFKSPPKESSRLLKHAPQVYRYRNRIYKVCSFYMQHNADWMFSLNFQPFNFGCIFHPLLQVPNAPPAYEKIATGPLPPPYSPWRTSIDDVWRSKENKGANSELHLLSDDI